MHISKYPCQNRSRKDLVMTAHNQQRTALELSTSIIAAGSRSSNSRGGEMLQSAKTNPATQNLNGVLHLRGSGYI